jgi:exodeoxyribonuclease VII large subunit
VKGTLNTLRAVGPESVLSRGYAIVRRAADDKIVRSTHQVAVGDSLNLRLLDGTIGATTDRIEPSPEEEE